MIKNILVSSCFLLAFALIVNSISTHAITIGSKKFTENVILAEIARQLIEYEGYVIHHKKDLGGTRILWEALLNSDIDIYPDYSGTLINEILSKSEINNLEELRYELLNYGIGITEPLGFDNTYVLGMKQDKSTRFNINSISDLKRYPDLKLGFSNEFMNRKDGWPGLKQHYELPQQDVKGLDHDIAYRGIESDGLDVIDMYSTDAEIQYYSLRTLRDDRGYFPAYRAVYLYRLELNETHPKIIQALKKLEDRFDEAVMIGLNAQVKIEQKSESTVAARFIQDQFNTRVEISEDSLSERVWHNTLDHLLLVVISLSAAILLAIPLGIAAARFVRTGQLILALAGMVQTIPALALLVFMIPLFGIGARPAIIALFLYSLLPIIRNTYTGLHSIPVQILESAVATGLPSAARLRLIELPLALRSILAGIKTSAVINIGTATLGALIGAGGYGQPILTGIRLDNTALILEGAVPAAVLALLVQGIFELLEQAAIPRGLRYRKID